MPSVTLTILGDATGARRALAETRAEYERASTALGGMGRRSAADRRRDEAEEIAGARRQLRVLHDARVRARLARKREDDAAAAQRKRDRHREEAEEIQGVRQQLRTLTTERQRAAREQKRIADEAVRDANRSEQRRTRDAEREERRRTRLAETEARRRRRAVEAIERRQSRSERQAAARGERGGHAAAAVVGTVATDAHGRIQAARQTVAERTSTLNTALVQRGTSQEENARDNATIQARLAESRSGVEVDVALAAIARAQSAANALGGDTRQQREAGIAATLDDVEFAGTVDPQNVEGIVGMGAILRRRVSDPALRRRILRGAVGTSFEGSVETDNMITSALPGLLEAIASGTANVAPEDRDRVTAEIAQDTFAQLQAQAASGRTVGVAANRTNTVRTALANADRQGRLGLALAEVARTGTAEQQAAFASTFTKDAEGVYRMNAATRDTPSNAARFFGTMFNNDAGALRNAMGTNGLGGRRQLMNAPDVSAIASYFGLTTGTDGSQVREYDHVEQLKRASLTPEQETMMAQTRAAEDRTRLIREREQALYRERPTGRPGLTTRASDAAASFATEHPVLSALGIGAGGMMGRAALGAAGSWVGSALGAVATAGMAPMAAMASLAAGGTALGLYGSSETLRTGRNAEGAQVSTSERALSGAALLGSGTLFVFAPVISAIKELPRQLAEALRAQPPTVTVDPHTEAHAASQAAGGRSAR